MQKFIVFIALLGCLISPIVAAQEYGHERLEKSFRVKAGKTLKARIDVDAGRVKVEASEFDQAGKVTLYYTAGEFDGRIDFDEDDARLRVILEKERWLRSEKKDQEAQVVVYLPTEVETELKTKIKAGEVDMDLGGLKIKDFVLKSWAGEVDVDFSKPNKMAMQRLMVNAKIGETTLKRLGNANFKDAEINGGIGELTIDFTGVDLKNSRAYVDLDIGQTDIVFPRETNIRMLVSKFLFLSVLDIPEQFQKIGRYYYLGQPRESSQEFFIRIKTGLGELKIDLQ